MMQAELSDGTLICRLSGDWTILRAADIGQALDRLTAGAREADRVVLQCGGLTHLDTSGAWLLQKAVRELRAAGHAVDMQGFREANFRLIEELEKVCPDDGDHTEGVSIPLSARFEALGRATAYGLFHLTEAVAFLGRVFVTGGRCMLRPRRIRISAVVAAMYHAGVTALPTGDWQFLLPVVSLPAAGGQNIQLNEV